MKTSDNRDVVGTTRGLVVLAAHRKTMPARSPYTGLERAGLCYRAGMTDFNELVAHLREPGEDGLSETIYDDLSSSYALAVDGGAARVAEVEAASTELVAEIARLKALNFDLLMAAGSEPAVESADETSTESDGEPSIDSLFDKE